MKHYEMLAEDKTGCSKKGCFECGNDYFIAGYKAAMEELNKYSSNPEHESFTTLIKSITDRALIYLNREAE